MAANFLNLTVVCLEHVFLALVALGQGEEDERLAIGVELARWFLDGGELGLERRERGVADGVGLGNVRRDVLVGLGEVWEDRAGETRGEGGGDVEGFGTVGVGFEG